jgi:hypothetical protein
MMSEKRPRKSGSKQPQEPTPELLKAAKEFGLDFTDPAQAAELLNALASVVYGKGKRGRPTGSKK